jgi:fluoride exporter
MTRLVLLFLAGGCGALARFGLSGCVHRFYGGELPLGTFVVNLVGCLLFGFIWTLADERMIISGETRFLILIGFVGSFTTFSTFSYETQALLRDAQWLLAAGNVIGQCLLGIVAVILGIALGRLV